MLRFLITLTLLITPAAPVLAVGFADDKDGQAARQVLLSVMEATIEGDRAAFLKGLSGKQVDLDAAAATFAVLEAQNQFRSAFEKTYGAEAWEAFQDPDGPEAGKPGETRYNATFNMPNLDVIQSISDSIPEKNGDGLVFKIAFGPRGTKFYCVKNGENWKVDAKSFVVAGDAEALAKMMSEFARIVDRHRLAIGYKEVKPEDIDFELGRDMSQKLFGIKSKAGDAPRRYDIDAIADTKKTAK